MKGLGAALDVAGKGLMQYTQYNIEEMRQKNLEAIRQRERGEDQAIHSSERAEDVAYRTDTAAAEQKRHEATLAHQRDENTFQAKMEQLKGLSGKYQGALGKLEDQRKSLSVAFNAIDKDTGQRSMSEEDYQTQMNAIDERLSQISALITGDEEIALARDPSLAERLGRKPNAASPIMDPPVEDPAAATPAKIDVPVVKAAAGKLGDPKANPKMVADNYNRYMKDNPKATAADVDAYMSQIWDSNWKDAVVKKGTSTKLSAEKPKDKAVESEFKKRSGGTEGSAAYQAPSVRPSPSVAPSNSAQVGRSAPGIPAGPNGMTVQGAIAADMNVMELTKAGASPQFVRAVLGEMKARKATSAANPSVPRNDAAVPAPGGKKQVGPAADAPAPGKNLNPTEVRALIAPEAEKAGVPPTILERMVAAESSGDPKAVSGKGAKGLAQFTASGGIAQLKKMGHIDDNFDPHDPRQAARAMSLYMKYLLDQFDGDQRKAVAAYNWGETKLRAAGDGWEAKAPKETKDYLRKVLG